VTAALTEFHFLSEFDPATARQLALVVS